MFAPYSMLFWMLLPLFSFEIFIPQHELLTRYMGAHAVICGRVSDLGAQDVLINLCLFCLQLCKDLMT